MGIYELLTQINNYVMLVNFAALLLFLCGKGFSFRLINIGRSPEGLLLVACLVLAFFVSVLEGYLISISNSYSFAVWPVRVFWYFGFAAFNLAAIYVALIPNNLKLDGLSSVFKSIAYTLTAKAFINIFGFIDRFVFSDYLDQYYQLLIPTLNIAIVGLMVVMSVNTRTNKNIKIDNKERRSVLLESGAALYLETLKEPDFSRSQSNHNTIKSNFKIALSEDLAERAAYNNVYSIHKTTVEIKGNFNVTNNKSN